MGKQLAFDVEFEWAGETYWVRGTGVPARAGGTGAPDQASPPESSDWSISRVTRLGHPVREGRLSASVDVSEFCCNLAEDQDASDKLGEAIDEALSLEEDSALDRMTDRAFDAWKDGD